MRRLLFAATGLIGLAVAFLLGQQLAREKAILPPVAAPDRPIAGKPASPPPEVPRPVPAVVPPAPPPPPLPTLATPPGPTPPALAAVEPLPISPSFDHVRIGAGGTMVAAGRAEPEAEVTILLGDVVLDIDVKPNRGDALSHVLDLGARSAPRRVEARGIAPGLLGGLLHGGERAGVKRRGGVPVEVELLHAAP